MPINWLCLTYKKSVITHLDLLVQRIKVAMANAFSWVQNDFVPIILDRSNSFWQGPNHFGRRCYFLPFHSIFCPSIPKIEEWKEIVILKLLFPSTFILILKIAISFHFYCYFLPFRNKRSGRKQQFHNCYFLPFYRIAIPFHFLLKWIS